MSACQIASPSPRPPIGTPSALMFEITFICGWSGRNGRPSGFGPGGSSSPKWRLNASSCGSERLWPRKRTTMCSSHAFRISPKVSVDSGCERSTPPISAPSASASFVTLSKLDDQRLMVRRLRLGVDAQRAKARRKIRRDKHVVAAVGHLAVVQMEGVLARLAGIQRLPCIDEARLEHAPVVRIVVLQVEVAAHERAPAPFIRFVAARFFDQEVLGARFEVQLAQPVDLRGAVVFRVVLQVRGHYA